jgi:hypothetical protein
MDLAKKVRQGLTASLGISGVLALLSLGMLGILTTNVVNLGRILEYATIGSVTSDVTTLEILKKVNGWLLIIPIAIFLMCSGDIGKTAVQAVNPKGQIKLIKNEAVKQISGHKGAVRKRPIIFGSIFILLGGAIIVDLILTAIAYGDLAKNTIPSDFPITLEKIERLRLVSLYTIIVPGLVVVFALVLIFKAIKEKKSQ